MSQPRLSNQKHAEQAETHEVEQIPSLALTHIAVLFFGATAPLLHLPVVDTVVGVLIFFPFLFPGVGGFILQ